MAERRQSLPQLLREVRACEICAPHLPLGPRPVLQVARGAAIAIVGQAPGTKVHESGKPWDDASGDHLREWLGIDTDCFYDPKRIAHLPMGFCYPGKKAGGDAPPRPECAPQWHTRVRERMPKLQLTLLCGMYAHRYYLGTDRKKTLGATVQAWREYWPDLLPLPHPSWRSRLWIEKNPWFKTQLLPVLRRRVRELVGPA